MCAPLDKSLSYFENLFKHFYTEHLVLVKLLAIDLFCFGYFSYFFVVCFTDFKRARELFALTIFAALCIAYWRIKKLYGAKINEKICEPIVTAVEAKWKLVKW